MTTKNLSIARALTVLLAVYLPASEARTLQFPTTWELFQETFWGWRIRPAPGTGFVPFDVPDHIANRLMYTPPPLVQSHSVITTWDVAWVRFPPAHAFGYIGFKGNTVWSAWQKTDYVYGYADHTIVPTCLTWAVYLPEPEGGTGVPLYQHPCIPITVIDPDTCSVTTSSVTLDHGTVTYGRPSRATAVVAVSCKKTGSGRLSLPSGSGKVPIGGGYATLSTDRGPLSTSMVFPAGSSSIQLVSTLTDVRAGMWSASTVITLDMD